MEFTIGSVFFWSGPNARGYTIYKMKRGRNSKWAKISKALYDNALQIYHKQTNKLT